MRWWEIVGRPQKPELPVEDDLLITVVMSVDDFAGLPVQLVEGRWMPSVSSGLLVRVDPADPRIPLQRHVHVAHKKHTRDKSMQASWNADKSRHDKKTFNAKLGGQASYQEAARAALGLEPETTLEWVNRRSDLIMLCEQIIPGRTFKVVLQMRTADDQ
jgi:hypothetical protein